MAGVAGIWGMVGFIICANLAGGGGFWLLYALGFFVVVALGHIYVDNTPKPLGDEGTYMERATNPELNTVDFNLHWKRLTRYGMSKYKGEMVFMGPRGGVYTITASGNRNYR